MTQIVDDWLAEAVRETLASEYDKVVRPFIAAMKKVARPPDIKPLNERKLRQLIRGRDVPLHASELRCLDKVLVGHPLSSRPILKRQTNLLDAYKREDCTVRVLVASKFNRFIRSDTVSRNDMRALDAILSCNGLATAAHVDMDDIFHRGGDVRRINADSWNTNLDPEQNYSLIGLGAPFANHASEKLLSCMFGVPSFTPNIRGLPCYFVWPVAAERQGVNHSSFLMDRRGFNAHCPKQAKELRRGMRAIVVGERAYLSERIGESYALIVAQRQPNGQLFVVIAGTYGPSTYGGALFTYTNAGIPAAAPRPNGEGTPVLTAVVRTAIGLRNELAPGQRELNENRRLKRDSLCLVSPVLHWNKIGDEWHPKIAYSPPAS